MIDAVAIARQLAIAHPTAKLPCPVCGASLNAGNLDKHLAKVHAGAAPAGDWRGKGALGVFPVSLSLTGDALVLRHMLGLAKRAVSLPCAIEVGATFAMRPEAGMGTYDVNTPGVEERTGRYLRLVGDRVITIGCTQSTQFTTHWERAGWTAARKRSSCDIRVAVDAMVAIEYALAARGVLRPATSAP